MTALAQMPGGGGLAGATPGFYVTHALNGRQKAAVIVRLLLSEGADLPLLALPDHLQAALTEQLGTMRSIDRDTLQAVCRDCVRGRDRVIVDQAESHRFVVGRVVAGWAHRAESALGFAAQNGIDREACSTCGAQRSFQ